ASVSLSNRSLEASYGISYKNESMTTEADQTLTIVTICFLSALASILTIGGNVMVIVSFVINRALRTVNNYLILSLAAADLVIGVVSMNLFTVFIVSGSWKLGAVLCDVWLALDYVASNASVMNLLIICLDRYYSVTKPVEYRNQRTPKRFITAIIGAWSISFILWAPWVLFWQFIVNKRTVPEDNCYVQFIKDSKPMAVITAIGAFYLPATVMCVLYWKVYIGIKNLAKDNSIISGSEDEHQSNSLKARMRHFFQHKSDFSAPNENNRLLDDKKVGPVTEGIEISQYVVKSLNGAQSIPTGEVSAINRLDTNNKEDQIQDQPKLANTFVIAVRRPSNREEIQFEQVVTDILCKREAKSNEEPTYTEGPTSLTSAATSASYHNIPTLQHRSPEKHPENASQTGADSPRSRTNSGRLGGIIKVTERLKLQVVKKKLQSLNKETKAARLLASILAAFILLWLPYNIMALVEAFCPLAEKCIPDLAWNFGYWFCYLNSTLNPVCYAMCNKNFQQTFKFLLSMKWIKPENRRYRAP
uniref:G-protein coupled receptors family 1 profile domain-containing protein n=1 Tax=Ciona savignyi TaxID=51511 RepID=H2ZNY8_CIOSA